MTGLVSSSRLKGGNYYSESIFSKKEFQDPIFEKRESKVNRVIEGNDLGIFLFFAGWFITGMLFTFSSNPIINQILNFYVFYDLMALGFVLIHFSYSHKLHSDEDYKFMHFKDFTGQDVFRGIGYVGLAFGILLISNFVINMSFVFLASQFDLIEEYTTTTNVILQVSRTIMTEELVFRGFILLLTMIFCMEICKLDTKIASAFAILISGVSFGLIHYFRYGADYAALISLMVLGFLCAFLTIKEGLWAAIVLHVVNNLVAIFIGCLKGEFLQLNFASFIYIFALLLAIVAIYVVVASIQDDYFIFQYFAIAMILFFIIGYYTNGLVRSEDFGGLYFEHFHVILFIPGVRLAFKNRCQDGKLYSAIIGCCLGFFISDFMDIINLSATQWLITLIYAGVALVAYGFIHMIVKINKKERY